MPKEIERQKVRAFRLKVHFLIHHGLMRNRDADNKINQNVISDRLGISRSYFSQLLNPSGKSGDDIYNVPHVVHAGLCDLFCFDLHSPQWIHGSAIDFEAAYRRWHSAHFAGRDRHKYKNITEESIHNGKAAIKDFLLGCTPLWGRYRVSERQKTLNIIEALLGLSCVPLNDMEIDSYVIPSLRSLISISPTGFQSETIAVETVHCAAMFVILSNRWMRRIPSLSINLAKAADLAVGRMLSSRNAVGGWGTSTSSVPTANEVRNAPSLWAYQAIFIHREGRSVQEVTYPFFQFTNHLATRGFGFQPDHDDTATVQSLTLNAVQKADILGIRVSPLVRMDEIIANVAEKISLGLNCETESYVATGLNTTAERLPFDHPAPLLALDSLISQKRRLNQEQKLRVERSLSQVLEALEACEGRQIALRGLTQTSSNPLTYPFCYLGSVLSRLEEEKWTLA